MNRHKRQDDPRNDFRRLDLRLEDWAYWWMAYFKHIGWNVVDLEDQASGVQKRNDIHADRVMMEIMRLDPDSLRNWTTNAAFRRLPLLWRNIVFCVYISMPQSSFGRVAEAVNIDGKEFRTHFRNALFEMESSIDGLTHQRTKMTELSY